MPIRKGDSRQNISVKRRASHVRCAGVILGRLGKTGEIENMSRVRVTINLSLLQSSMSAADKNPVSEAEVRQFLVDSGFTPEGVCWIVEEKDLGQLDPSEVTHAKRLD